MARILIVDDDAAFGELLSDILGSLGHQAFTAESGEAAVERVRAGCRPDLVLVDLQMLELDGLKTIDLLRVEADGAPCALVMLTASTSDEAAAEARAHGASGFLSKPIRMEVIGPQIARFLGDPKLVWLDDHHTVTRAA